MTKPVSYTPPGLAYACERPRTASIGRRHVVYLPGYDPEARTRYRLLFVRELTRYFKRFGHGKPEISRATLSEDGLVQSWSVRASATFASAQTSYDVLLWDDIVARDTARPRLISAALLVTGTLHALLRGKLFTFYRLNWKYGNVILYPFVMLMLLGLASALIATLVHDRLHDWAGHALPVWLTLPLGILVGLLWVRAIEALLNRIFFWQLLNDWVFNWQHGQGLRPDHLARLEVFADHVLKRIDGFARDGEHVDELLLVGHSTGGLVAVELVARLLSRRPDLGAEGPLLSLATLGSGLPLVALQPRARRLRAEIASLATARHLTWVEFVAPQDWLNFPRFNPLIDLDLPLAADAAVVNPMIRSARFREIMDEEAYRKALYRPFRMHFQFLMSNDKPGGAYDFFALTLGPKTLRQHAFADGPVPEEETGAAHETLVA